MILCYSEFNYALKLKYRKFFYFYSIHTISHNAIKVLSI